MFKVYILRYLSKKTGTWNIVYNRKLLPCVSSDREVVAHRQVEMRERYPDVKYRIFVTKHYDYKKP